jgi:hypothetical protein
MRVETATLQMESRTRVHRIRRSNPLTVSLILLVLLCGASPSRGAATTDDTRLPLHGVSPDRFVQGAPLTVAAVCRDGVALLAAHAPDDDEPLLYHRHFDENGVDERPNQDSTENSPAFQDLPSDFGGPFRIHPIDGTGTVLASTGWRADCERLVAVAQSLASSERLRYGPPDIGQIYSQYLATELSLYMAQCAASEGLRALSCVGIMAATGHTEEKASSSLWFVDSTGAYPVRAFCVGGGFAAGGTPVARLVNDRLCTMDFSRFSTQEAVSKLLELLAEKVDGKNAQPLLNVGSRVEVGIVKSSATSRLIRLPIKNL